MIHTPMDITIVVKTGTSGHIPDPVVNHGGQMRIKNLTIQVEDHTPLRIMGEAMKTDGILNQTVGTLNPINGILSPVNGILSPVIGIRVVNPIIGTLSPIDGILNPTIIGVQFLNLRTLSPVIGILNQIIGILNPVIGLQLLNLLIIGTLNPILWILARIRMITQ